MWPKTGKTRQRTFQPESAEQGRVYVLALSETSTVPVLAQHQVREKEHEISAVKTWLQAFQVRDRIVWADAMPTQRCFCALLRRYHSHSLLKAREESAPVVGGSVALFCAITRLIACIGLVMPAMAGGLLPSSRLPKPPKCLPLSTTPCSRLFDWLHVSNLAAQMRVFDAHPKRALALLLGSDF
jgi:hypothetical protein